MTDYLSQLPFEVRSDICSHLADLLSCDSQARKRSLAALRLTCRAWKEPPMARLFHSLDRSLWGSNGLKALYRLSLHPSIARHVRILNLRVNLYVEAAMHIHDQESHKEPVTIDILTESDINLPRCWRCNPLEEVRRHLDAAVLSIISPSPLLIDEQLERLGFSKLTQIFRSIFVALNRLDSVSIENPFPLKLTQGQADISNDFSVNEDLGIWPRLSRDVNGDILTGFITSDRPIGFLMHVHTGILQGVTARLDGTTPLPGTLTISAFEYRFHLDTRPLLTTLLCGALDPNANFDHVHALDLGRPPNTLLDAPHHNPASLASLPAIRLHTLFALQRLFPSLTHLTLRSFSFDAPTTLTQFLASTMPNLKSLSLDGDKTELRSGNWWAVFQQLRACPVKLARFRLLGTRLYAWQSCPWYISSGHDPRPDPMGDSLEFDMVEKWVMGEDMDDPSINANESRQRRVMVWNTRRD